MSEAFVILFSALFASVFVWFFLVSRLYRLLKTNHPGKYREMGEPTLFWNNAPKHSVELLKFLVTREYSRMGDSEVTRLGNIMLVFFILFMLGFLILSFGIPFGYANVRTSI